MQDLQDQAIRQHCKALRMPTIGGQFARLAERVNDFETGFCLV